MTPRVLARITGQFWPESATGLPAVAVIGPDGVAVTTGAVDAGLPLASVTKPLVAYAVLVAVEEGSLALDGALTADAGTSLRHLLAHASGMAPDERPRRGASTRMPASRSSATFLRRRRA